MGIDRTWASEHSKFCVPVISSVMLYQCIQVEWFNDLTLNVSRFGRCSTANFCVPLAKKQFAFAKLMREASVWEFTETNIRPGFVRSGLFPLDFTNLLGLPLPLSAENRTRILSCAEMFAICCVQSFAASSYAGCIPHRLRHSRLAPMIPLV